MIHLELVEILFLSFSCSIFLFLWLETNGFYEYISYFNLGGKLLCDYREYMKKEYATLNFVMYLLLNHNCFFTRLICCSICLGFWINLAANLMFFKWQNFPFSFVLSLVIYYILVILKKGVEK
tara:strand:+ start:2383 stop:2751 length:369 start_codon:yes stop_codon:yes gene_type:complete